MVTATDEHKGWSSMCIAGNFEFCLGCKNPAHGNSTRPLSGVRRPDAEPDPAGMDVRLAVLQALAREDGGIEHTGGRCLSMLSTLTGHVYRSNQLADAIRACEASGFLTRDVAGTKTKRIDLTDRGIDFLDGKPATLPPATPKPRLAPPRPPKDDPVPDDPTPDIKIAGGSHAPTIAFVLGEAPPAPPVKPRPLSLAEALDTSGVFAALAENAMTWAKVAHFPTIGGAGSAAKKLKADQQFAGYEWTAIRNAGPKTSTLYGRYVGGA